MLGSCGHMEGQSRKRAYQAQLLLQDCFVRMRSRIVSTVFSLTAVKAVVCALFASVRPVPFTILAQLEVAFISTFFAPESDLSCSLVRVVILLALSESRSLGRISPTWTTHWCFGRTTRWCFGRTTCWTTRWRFGRTSIRWRFRGRCRRSVRH